MATIKNAKPIAKTLFQFSTVSELREKLGYSKGKGTFEHEETKIVFQDWKKRRTTVVFNDLSKLHFSLDKIKYSL